MPLAMAQLHTMAPKQHSRRSSARKLGRIWLRATDAEWSAIKAAAESERLTRSQWIISTLVDEAAKQKGLGRFTTSTAPRHRSNRQVEGEILSDSDVNPKHNIYCDPTEEELIKGVAKANGCSVNYWAMRILNAKVADLRLEELRRQNMIAAQNQDRMTPELEKQLRAGKIPAWMREAMRIIKDRK